MVSWIIQFNQFFWADLMTFVHSLLQSDITVLRHEMAVVKLMVSVEYNDAYVVSVFFTPNGMGLIF